MPGPLGCQGVGASRALYPNPSHSRLFMFRKEAEVGLWLPSVHSLQVSVKMRRPFPGCVNRAWLLRTSG